MNNSNKLLPILALPILMLGMLAANRDAAAQTFSGHIPRPIPETTPGDCTKVGSNLYDCCEEDEGSQMTVCFIKDGEDAGEDDRREQPVLTSPRK